MRSNDNLELRIADDAMQVVLVDKRRGCEWRLDPSKRLADKVVLPAGMVEQLPDGFRVTHQLPAGAIVYRWTLASDHVRVELEKAPDAVNWVSLPGSFLSGDGKNTLLLSAYQGVMYRPTGETWEDCCPPGAHWQFSMAMNALLSRRGGLMITSENVTDWVGAFGDNETSPYFFYTPLRCEVEGWYKREVRLYPVAPNINAVAKRYRKRVQERGEFVSWEEKIARKPALEQLFGALIAFTGYNHAPEVDYVASARALSKMGFENVLYYPVRIASHSLDFLMGGDKPIWLADDTLKQIKDIPGALISPWGWVVEALDDGSKALQQIYRRNPDGTAPKGWSIEKQQWYLVCPGEQIGVVKKWWAKDLQAMDWIHYDVNATALGRQVCFAKDHASHPGKPLSRSGEVERTLEILGPGVNGNRIVSSEGFIDRYTPSYDIGSTKLWPAGGPGVDFITVPLTMLVYHDSTVHNWWEPDTYNPLPANHGRKQSVFGVCGSGGCHKMAAQDALYGCPPQVFPFGRQYGWVDMQTRRTLSYCIQLADANVQVSLKAALPVAQLHKRIGKLEMMSFDLLTDDGAVQTTQFSDGTRIVANISDKRRDTDYGSLKPDTWKEIKPT